MNGELNETVERINFQIQQYTWFYLQIESYDGRLLTITGSEDFAYHIRLVFVLTDIFYLSAYFESFNVNTEQSVIEILADGEAEDFRWKFKIPKDYKIFKILAEDFSPLHIAAKDIEIKENVIS